jgi:DNA invertase Pin-like site-specific DNA recombinase
MIMPRRFVSYLRVSTDRQGKSGLGVEAQRAAVLAFLNGGAWTLLHEFVEVESGKTDDHRPELHKALEHCKLTGATLIVAKLDRLSRDAAFLLNLSKSGVDVRACDIPEANTMMFGIMAVFAQHERELISKRTKDALAASKARGTKLGGWRGGPVPDSAKATEARQKAADGFAASVAPMIRELRRTGCSLAKIAATLTERGIRTARNGRWSAASVSNVLKRQPPATRRQSDGRPPFQDQQLHGAAHPRPHRRTL